MKEPRAALPPDGSDQLARFGPKSIRHLFAEAVSNPGNQQKLPTDGVQVRISGGHAERVER